MDDFLQYSSETHIYRLKRWIQVLFVAMAFGAVGFGLLFVFMPDRNGPPGGFVLWLLFPATTLIGFYLTAGVFRYFVSLDKESVSVGGIFQTRTLHRESIKGFRTISSRNGTILIIESQNPTEKSLKIADYYNFDDHWSQWFYSLADLDAEDSQATLETIANAPQLGGTPEVRLQKLRQAKTIAFALNAITIVAGGSAWFLGSFLEPNMMRGLMILLALLPWGVLWIQMRWPLLYNLFGRKKDPRPTLAFVLILSGFGILIPTLRGIHSDHHPILVAYGIAIGLILVFLLKATTRESTGRVAEVVSLGAFCCIYGYGLSFLINTQLDKSPTHNISTQILNMRITHGKSTTYYLDVVPWDSTIGRQELSVPQFLYQSLGVGDQVCITTHAGALNAGWYTVHLCP